MVVATPRPAGSGEKSWMYTPHFCAVRNRRPPTLTRLVLSLVPARESFEH